MINNTLNESKVDIAYRLLLKSRSKKGKDFYSIWEEVKNEIIRLNPEVDLEELDNEISYFHTNLTLDSRFIYITKEEKWNLKERVSLEEIADTNIDIDLYDNVEPSDGEDDDEDREPIEEEPIDDSIEDSFDDSTGSDANMTWNEEEQEEEDL